MKIIPHYQTIGDIVNLKTSRKNHINDTAQKFSTTDAVTDNFANLLTKSLDKVNNLELKSTDLTNQMAVNPDSVNIHDVLIAAEQAEMSILLTKGILDRAIRSYKEITSMR
jgi:flagellar hook-basal body complex protein FliE